MATEVSESLGHRLNKGCYFSHFMMNYKNGSQEFIYWKAIEKKAFRKKQILGESHHELFWSLEL